MKKSKEEVAAYQKAYRKANKEKLKAYDKAWREENKVELAAKGKLYNEANKERIATNGKAWYKANPERVAANHKAWKQNNPERCRAHNAKRRAAAKGVNENFPAKERLACKERFNHQCFRCASKENLAVDHYRALNKGHALTPTNAVVLCGSCNSSKYNKDPEEYFTQIEVKILEGLFWNLENLKEKNYG